MHFLTGWPALLLDRHGRDAVYGTAVGMTANVAVDSIREQRRMRCGPVSVLIPCSAWHSRIGTRAVEWCCNGEMCPWPCTGGTAATFELPSVIVMSHQVNHLGQPIGPPIPGWTPPPFPPREPMEGRFCRVEPLDPARHAASLCEAFSLDTEGRIWTYLPYGPFETCDSYRAWVDEFCTRKDPMFHAIVERTSGKALGAASYSRIDPLHGTIEVGHISYSFLLQRKPAATEAMYLMMRRVFELGYRRYEWKCDALNAESRAAARRLGFLFEGIFRQATTYKGRSRDTAWFAVIDREWPLLKSAFERWLDPANFDEKGKQKSSLSELTAHIPKTPVDC